MFYKYHSLIEIGQKPYKMQVRISNNERISNQKKLYGITLPKHETTFHTCIQTFEQYITVAAYIKLRINSMS